MDDEKQPSETPSRPTRPTSSRNFSGRVFEDAEKRNREILSIVRQMSAHNMLENEPNESARRKYHEEEEEEDDDDEDDDDDDEDEIRVHPQPDGGYDPNEFEQIAAPAEIKDLFQYITKYSPQNIELEYKLAPFIPDFIPAVGDIDAFIKVMRPDDVASDLGLRVLDEPCTKQSDPAVLHLQLRATTKETSAKRVVVKKVENANKHHKAIDRWIKDINELHKSKHSSSMNYSNPMPDVDTLMQEWPADFEDQLANIESLNRHLDCDLPTLVDTVCSVLDIPVYESRIESLHLLFSLYSAVKNIQMKADPATTNLGETN